MTDWYIQEELYLEKSLVYNSVSIFALIENVKYIEYNFTGNSYKINRKIVEEKYPNYSKIIGDSINTANFNQYLESKMSDIEFVQEIDKEIFKQ